MKLGCLFLNGTMIQWVGPHCLYKRLLDLIVSLAQSRITMKIGSMKVYLNLVGLWACLWGDTFDGIVRVRRLIHCG